MTERGRLFVAAWPSSELCGLLAALPRPAAPGVRYTTPEQWHVTLRFLGDASLREAGDALRQVTFAAADAIVGPAVTRLGKGVVIAPVAGLDAIATAVDHAMSGIGEQPEHKGYAGHLTLARLKSRSRLAMLEMTIEARFAVSEIHLVHSQLTAKGSRYETIATVSAVQIS